MNPSAPKRIEVVGGELAVVWSDGTESYLPLTFLRRRCPCAVCLGEQDLVGQVHGGGAAQPSDKSFALAGYEFVGGYAIRPRWQDGHDTGIFSFDYLRELAANRSD